MSESKTLNILIPSRSSELLTSLLDRYACVDLNEAKEFEFPQYSDTPQTVLYSLKDIIDFLSHKRDARYYIGISNNEPGYAYLSYVDNDNVVFGIEVVDVDPLLKDILEETPVPWAYVGGEEYPPESYEDFVRICVEASLPKIVDYQYFG